MEYKIKWLSNASLTYLDEIDFNFEKWNYKEVQKFILLVDENLKRLSVNPKIGIPIKNMFRLVLSKQTTLFYTIQEKENRVDLIIFWNNSKNPDGLIRLL